MVQMHARRAEDDIAAEVLQIVVADVELHAERGQAAEHLAQLLLGLAVVYRDVRARLEKQGDERRVAHTHADDRYVLSVYFL